MRSLTWDRAKQISELRPRLWKHLSAAAEFEDNTRPDAAALLQLEDDDVRLLAELHFLLSGQVRDLLGEMPALVRQLATTTVTEEEQSPERVRGAISWGRTLTTRLSTGVPSMYVTTPARRAHQTPENELLVAVLDAIAERGSRLGLPDRKGIGHELTERLARTRSFRQRRVLAEIERRPVTPRSLSRVRGSRARRRYECAIQTFELYQSLVERLDPEVVREAVEQRALVTRSDPILFEIAGTFAVIEALSAEGWDVSPLRLFGHPRALKLTAKRGEQKLELWYQQIPKALSQGSRYVETLQAHSFSRQSAQPLRPDLVMRHNEPGKPPRWVLGEVKLGVKRSVSDSARAALADLLGYRRDFHRALDQQEGPYGLGLAWGQELSPSENDEVLLCTPDTIRDSLRIIFD